MSAALALLQQRHSVPSRQLGEPAPDEASLHALLEAAIRVPDHGKLVPFRLIRLQDEAKLRFGEQLAALAIRNDPELSDAKLEKERLRYTFAPLVMVVVACLHEDSKVPEIEQKLCAGNVAYNLLLGAHALGYVAGWVTGWYTYSERVSHAFCRPGERIAGFIFIGHPSRELEERPRATLPDVWRPWAPPGH